MFGTGKLMFAGIKLLTVDPTPTIQTASSGTNIALNKPAGTVSGDLLVSALTNSSGTPTWTPDAAFTERLDSNIELATRTAGGSEASTYTFTSSSSAALKGTILRIPGAAYDVVGSVASGISTAVAPSVTMSAAGLLLAIFFSNSASITFTTPPGMTPVIADGTNGSSIAIFSQPVGPGATGSVSSTANSGTGRGVLLGVKKL